MSERAILLNRKLVMSYSINVSERERSKGINNRSYIFCVILEFSQILIYIIIFSCQMTVNTELDFDITEMRFTVTVQTHASKLEIGVYILS